MLVLATPQIEGKKIVKYLGLVSASGTAVVYEESKKRGTDGKTC